MDKGLMSGFSLANLPARTALLAACSALLACTQPAAIAQAEKETVAMKADPMEAEEEAAKAAANAAAAAADAAAGPPPVAGEGGQPVDEPAKLPQGPALSADDLLKRTLKVVSQLRTPADTEPKQVAQALDLALATDSTGKRVGLTGSLTDGGSYAVEVWPLYGDQAPGQRVDVRSFTANWSGDPREQRHRIHECTVEFAPFHARMTELGFQAKEPLQYLPERWSFYKEGVSTAFYVAVDVYRTKDRETPLASCVMAVSINAARVEDVHGGN